MPKQTATAVSWDGAPPFEAQLVHYGLKSSKTKAVARMRLVDAVNAGNLSVPEHVSKLEAKLKKEWTKNDKDLKKVSSSSTGSGLIEAKKATAATGKKPVNKRKAEATLTPATSSTGTAKSNTKKAKTAATAKATTRETKLRVAKTEPEGPKVQKKQTARRGGHSQGLVRGASTAVSQPQERPARTKQTARRSSAFMARGRIPAPSPAQSSGRHDYDMNSENQGYDEDGSRGYDEDEDNYDEDDSDIVLAPLGLLNGSYEIQSEYVESEWNVGSEFSLDLTLEGSSLWGSFDLGILEGVILFEERPWQSSHDPVPIIWRGRELDGPISYGDQNEGWMKFYGNGRVEGWIDFSSITFQGDRLQGQGTQGTKTAKSLRNEWLGYSEDQYEYENRSRW
ncbi:hypothetical protein CMQ_4166 [Grosmannia clavigera kw1407]|uniref:Uncharacterized protein n=1 Tax=Grosmannia clavigera (strain kw1407 / UAMH 11150) TaxID=655863 RepID=F0XAT2_GROCL|nr:uncharacterized protein CMQ_4166 [Grosmannia clavigera kw1407]EFX06097.1 hypothetical protein CMQ_4166 [Grosmannia clavigera kw1407]